MAPLQILVVGQTFAILCGGIDLSLASVLALSGVVGTLAVPHVGLPGRLAIMLATGVFFGLLNGTIIVGFSVSPLIVTLGMLSVAKGLALLFTGGLPLYSLPESLVSRIGFGSVAGFPTSSLLAFAIMLVGAIVL